MRVLLLVAGAALTLTACGGGDKAKSNTANSSANMTASDNSMMMEPAPMGGNTMGGNTMQMDPTTQNMMKQDMNTNAPDTNLANGM